jgi:hypothetical protein
VTATWRHGSPGPWPSRPRRTGPGSFYWNPGSRLQCHDLFLTAPGGYLTGFHGPGKYDGSVMNWVNGPLLALAGSRRGFDVQITPARRPGVNVKTLTAQVRD